MANYGITSGSQDQTYGTNPSWNSTTIQAKKTSLPATTNYCQGIIQTQTIPDDDIISAATLYFYVDSFSKTGSASIRLSISGTQVEVYTSLRTGWNSYVLTAGELALINKTSWTAVRIDPSASAFTSVTLDVRAYEYTPIGTFSMYLDVTHESPIPPEVDTPVHARMHACIGVGARIHAHVGAGALGVILGVGRVDGKVCFVTAGDTINSKATTLVTLPLKLEQRTDYE